jgi:hypothetical protein
MKDGFKMSETKDTSVTQVCEKCQHIPYTSGICSCSCHPLDSIAGQFNLTHPGMTAKEFMYTIEFKTQFK